MKFPDQPTSFHSETLYAGNMTEGAASFIITRPPETARAIPLVFASPHSGDHYPADMGAAPGLSCHSLRSAEDALVASLVSTGPSHGAPLIESRIGRAYVDLNRDPSELDPSLIEGVDGPVGLKTAAGYGVIPRLGGDGTPLYARTLTRAEAEKRIATAHTPYHTALSELMQAERTQHGRAVLIDWHSMPSRAVGAEVVLGDRHGSSCDARLTRTLRSLFEGLGWRVALNHPYAGGWSTHCWGRPDEGFESIQIEISRGLYLDEATLKPNAANPGTRKALARVVAALCADTPSD